MATKGKHSVEAFRVGDRAVSVSNPDKVLFPEPGYTKRDLVLYYLAVAEGALRGAGGRPNMMVRYPSGVAGDFFFQKRAPATMPEWLRTVELRFPSGRAASEIVPEEPAALAWMANLGCLELHPHPVRADDLDHPDELRVDLDPVRGVEWPQVRAVAQIVRGVLTEHGLTGWPKTSGSRGLHVLVRTERRWGFDEVRRAALALARAVEQQAPRLASSKWWKEERLGVFVDYNQNAKDRTVASAYSVRPRPTATVSAPLIWDEVDHCETADFTLKSMPERYAQLGDRHAGIDDSAGSLDSLLELSRRHERDGLGDAPWPPHYRKQSGEPARAPPSRRRTQHPLIEVARAQRRQDAEAEYERWRDRHPQVAAYLQPADVLVDAMRGRSSTWTRVRINLQHVPPDERPRAANTAQPDATVRRGPKSSRKSSRARKEP
jgi:DNA ligase D-like protein (predicted polymerase)